MKRSWLIMMVLAAVLGLSDLAGASPVRIALYDDTASPTPSAWAAGLDALEQVLRAAGMQVRRLGRDELNGVGLGEADVIVVGGGYAYPGYTRGISEAGKRHLRQAVERGVGYVGVCAGAWFACPSVVYEGKTYGAESGYDLSLYPTAAHGPVPGLPAYPAYGLAAVRYADRPDLGVAAGEGHLWYGGGPYFTDLPAGVRAIADYEAGGAAAVSLEVGKGRVVLWGAHAEFPGHGVEAAGTARFVASVRWASRTR